MRKTLKGMGVAIVTPFTNDGEVDYAALENLVQMHLDCGTDFLCVLGTTGETPTLTTDEKREIRKRIIKQVDGRMPIMVGIGGNCTRAVVEELQNEDLTGVDGILSVAPYYNKGNTESLYRHFATIANAVNIPIILYNVPSRTGIDVPISVYQRLSRIPNIAGVKEASNDITKIAKIRNACGEQFTIWSGNDDQIVPLLSLGGKGVISVLSNILPKPHQRDEHTRTHHRHNQSRHGFDGEVLFSPFSSKISIVSSGGFRPIPWE